MTDKLLCHLHALIPGSDLMVTALPLCPQISLRLIASAYARLPLGVDQIEQLMNRPPYWAFCWASGQAMARRILAEPSLVLGRQVLDFGAGSGVVAIAAAMAGAKATVCDSDPVALMACRENAGLNGVELEYCSDMSAYSETDIICIADVFYDAANLPLLAQITQRFEQVLVADSRLKGRELAPLRHLGSIASHTVPDVEEADEFNCVHFYQS